MRLLALALMLLVAPVAAQDVDALRRSLQSDDPDTRWRAAWSLGHMGEQAKPAIPGLAIALGDRDEATRFAAEIALARLGAAETAARIVADRKQSSYARRGAAGVLMRLRDEHAVPQLAAALKSSNTELRRRAIEALASIGQPAAPVVPQLVKLLRDKSLHDALAGAFTAIGQPAVEPLARAVRKGATNARCGAAKALGYLGRAAVPALIEALDDKKDVVVFAACEALARLGKEASAAEPALVKVAADFNPRKSRAATRALRDTREGQPAAVFLRRLKDVLAAGKNPETLTAAVYVVADHSATKEAVPVLMRLLQIEDDRLLMATCHALGMIGKDAVAARAEICRVLMEYRNPDKVKALLDRYVKEAWKWYPGDSKEARAARDEWVEAAMALEPVGWRPPRVRVVAMWALARLRDPGDVVLPALRGVSQADKGIVRNYALAARWVLGDRESDAAEALARELERPENIFASDDAFHIDYAQDMIAMLGPEARELIPDLVRNELWNSHAMIAMGEDAVPALRTGLRAISPRERVLRALTALGPEAKGAALDLVLLCRAVDFAPAAERALEAIGPAAVPWLIEGLGQKSPSVRRSSARVLGRLKADEAVPALRRLAAEDPDVWVRYEAERAAARN